MLEILFILFPMFFPFISFFIVSKVIRYFIYSLEKCEFPEQFENTQKDNYTNEDDFKVVYRSKRIQGIRLELVSKI